ncbi:MAG: N-acetylmuramoyl-L-alanine amidase [Nocardioidaceae bacterium]
MPDRGEFSVTRSVLTSPSTLVAITALAAGLLVSVPSGADAGSPLAIRSRGQVAVPGEPITVRPTVREVAIPATSPSAKTVTPSLALSRRSDERGTGLLAAHVRLRDVGDFSMLGVTWAPGAGDDVLASVRTLSAGTWSVWTDLHVDEDEGPAASEESAARDGTGVLWVDDASGVEVAVYTKTGGAPRDLEVSTIDPGTSTYDLTATQTTTTTELAVTGGFPTMPRIITRREWGADPSLGDPCWAPRYGKTFKNVFVHHTVTSNDYSEAEAPGIVRGIYAYHTQSQGWCDIGYNFLVDKYGNVYEGRRGGIRQPVRGAHAGDYNTDSTGISLMGDFERGYPTRKMKHALVGLIAWRMGTAYHGAFGKAFIYDRKFKRISGHRDAMSTACPGQHVYDWLPRLRDRVAERLGTWQSVIERRWRAMGAASGWLGKVRVGERGITGGHWTAFAGGRLYASEVGLIALREGSILRAYNRAGGAAGRLGFPARRIERTRDGSGLVAAFDHGFAWWSSRTGAKAVSQGPLLRRYRKLGMASGRLGFPTSTNFQTRNGGRLNLEHGYLVFDKITRRVTVTYR